MNRSFYIHEYSRNIFPELKQCPIHMRICRPYIEKNTCPDFAFIGSGYSNYSPKILILGEIPFSSGESFPTPYHYRTFLKDWERNFQKWPIYSKVYGLRDMIEYINSKLLPRFYITMNRIAFSNYAHCYHRGIYKSAEYEESKYHLKQNCGIWLIKELELLKPQIIIGLFSESIANFKSQIENSNSGITYMESDQDYCIKWKFNFDHEYQRIFLYLIHPGFAATHYKNRHEFNTRLSFITRYYGKYYPNKKKIY